MIADDITGAAEIAGIAFSHGQQARLVCATDSVDASSVCCDTGSVYCDSVAVTTVIATDTRSMSEAEAIAETRRIGTALSPLAPSPRERAGVRSHLFKKTDSALRGHVVAELSALMQATGYQRCVYLPANPSKGRIIRGGVYYIREASGEGQAVSGKRQAVSGEGQEVREVPIHKTAFSYDPEFPAKTSVLKERFPDACDKGIIMPDAESLDDIRRVVAAYDDGQTLFAGAADLFSAISPISPNSPNSPIGSIGSTLILCGSTQSKPLDLGIPIAPMPLAVYDGSNDISLWDTTVYDTTHSLILTMPFTHRTGKEAAVHLRTVMARKVKALVETHRPEHLIIEGGATAWATLLMLGWTQFDLVRQMAPGVVQMRASNGTLITLKPGSYPWAGL